MDNEESSKEASASSVSVDSRKSSIGSFKYVRKVSTSLIGKPIRLAASFRRVRREDRKSMSAEDVIILQRKETQEELPSFTKVRSLPRDGRIRSGSVYCDLPDQKTISPAKSDVMSLRESHNESDEMLYMNKGRSYSITYDHFSYINSDHSAQMRSSPDPWLKAAKEEFTQCKEDIEKVKTSFDLFKKEVREGFENLQVLIKEDQDRYTKLCYKLHNVTDLHQTQLQYLQSLVVIREEDNNKNQDECMLDVLCDNLKKLETRILRL
jgi:hypothetical protein